MPICPTCKTELDKKSTSLGLLWVCPSCDGRAVSVEVVKKAVPNDIVDKLLDAVRSGRHPQKRRCPACGEMMAEVPITNKGRTGYLDACTGCSLIWFDPGGDEGLPKVPITSKGKLPAEVEKEPAGDGKEMEEFEKTVGALLGAEPSFDDLRQIIRTVSDAAISLYDRMRPAVNKPPAPHIIKMGLVVYLATQVIWFGELFREYPEGFKVNEAVMPKVLFVVIILKLAEIFGLVMACLGRSWGALVMVSSMVCIWFFVATITMGPGFYFANILLGILYAAISACFLVPSAWTYYRQSGDYMKSKRLLDGGGIRQ